MPYPPLTRRQLLRGAAAGIATVAAVPHTGATGHTAVAAAPRAGATGVGATVFVAGAATAQRDAPGPYADDVLPAGVRSRFAANVNGLRMHVLEAGSKAGGRAGASCCCTAFRSSPIAGDG